MKNKIMEKIRNRDIEMRSRYFFWAKKMGLQSLLAFSIVLGALLLNILFYFFKKTNAIYDMPFGWSRVGKILLALPYDYIFLFFITILLANYIVHKFDLSCGIKMNYNIALIVLLVMTVLLSSFFLKSGIEDGMKFWAKNKIMEKSALPGK